VRRRRLHHTNIVPVFDIGVCDGIHFYAMQLIQGQSLDDVIGELRHLRGSRADSMSKSIPVRPERSDLLTQSDLHYYRSVAQIGLQVASALAHAHGQRILHRDIKPSNLLLDAHGTIWVSDFGLAKDEGDDLTRSGDIVGTLRYMAPERFGGDADARSDIYSLGLTLYELVTLTPAFADTDRVRLVQAIAQEEPKAPRHFDPHLPRDLETILLKAISKEPGNRYSSAAELEEDSRRFLADRPILARRTSLWERVGRWCRRNRGWAATIVLALGLLIVAAVGGTVMSFRLQHALDELQHADREKTEKLWQSQLERARALRLSGRVGQRFEALKVIREAAKIKVTPELRDEAAAALVLPDVEIVREWEGYPAGSLNFAQDADFQRYVRLNAQGELTVYGLTPGGVKVSTVLPAHGKPPYKGLWMSPDGRFVAYGHSCVDEKMSGGVRVWRLDGAAPSVYADADGVYFHAAAFSPDSRRLALGHFNGTISLFYLREAKDLGAANAPRLLPVGQPQHSLAFDPNNGKLAVACMKSIRLFDLTTAPEREMPALVDPKVEAWTYGLAWHPKGRVLAATAEHDHRIHLWDTETGAATIPPLTGHTTTGILMAFNRAGDRLVSTGWDQQTRLWDPLTGRLLLTVPGNCGTRFSADGTLIGIGGSNKKLQLWRIAEGRELRVLRRLNNDNTDWLHSPVLDADGRLMAAASEVGLSFFDVATGKELASIHIHGINQTFPRSFHKQDGWMTGGNYGVLLWRTARDSVDPSKMRIGPPRQLAPPGPAGAGASLDGRMRIIPQCQKALVLDRDHPKKRIILEPLFDVRNAALSPDGRWAATFSWWWDARFKSVQIWEAETGRHVLDLPGEKETEGAFSPDGRWLAVGTNQDCQLWKVGTWKPGKRFDKGAFGWSADGKQFVINDVAGVIRFVEPETGRELYRLAGLESSWCLPGSLSMAQKESM